MHLHRKMGSYQKLMTPETYAKFKRRCQAAVDFNARNSPNFKSKDLAERQIEDLANGLMMSQERSDQDGNRSNTGTGPTNGSGE